MIKSEYPFTEITLIDLAALQAMGYEAVVDGDARVVRVHGKKQEG